MGAGGQAPAYSLMVSCCAGVASGAAAGCLRGAGRGGGGGRWLVLLAAAVPGRSLAAGVRRGRLLRVMMAPAIPVRMRTQPVTWRFRNAMWAVIAKAMMAPAATSVSDVAVSWWVIPSSKTGAGPVSSARRFPRVLAGFGLAGAGWR